MILATAHSKILETQHQDVTTIKGDYSWRTPVTLTLASWAIGQSDPKFQHFAFKSRLGLIRIFCFLNHKSVLEGSKAIGPINFIVYEMLNEEKRPFPKLKIWKLLLFSSVHFQSSTNSFFLSLRLFSLSVSSPFLFARGP